MITDIHYRSFQKDYDLFFDFKNDIFYINRDIINQIYCGISNNKFYVYIGDKLINKKYYNLFSNKITFMKIISDDYYVYLFYRDKKLHNVKHGSFILNGIKNNLIDEYYFLNGDEINFKLFKQKTLKYKRLDKIKNIINL